MKCGSDLSACGSREGPWWGSRLQAAAPAAAAPGVAKRNARERRRVQAVNSAFCRLRRAVAIEGTRGKRVSKVKTLQKAIEYIQHLQHLLQLGAHLTNNNVNAFDDCFNFVPDYGAYEAYNM